MVNNASAVLGWPAIFSALGGLLFSLLLFLPLLWVTGTFSMYGQTSPDPVSVLGQVFIVLTLVVCAAVIPMAFAATLSQAITVAPSARGVIGLRTRFGQAWLLVRPALGRIFGFSALVSLFCIVLLAVLLGALFLMILGLVDAIGTGFQRTWEEGIAVFVSMIFLFIFAVIILSIGLMLLLVRFIFAVPIIVLEGLGPVAALQRSWTLIRGRYWPVLGTYVLFSVLISIVVQILVMILSVPTGLVDFTSTDPFDSAAFTGAGIFWVILSTTAQIILSMVLSVYLFVVVNYLYIDLRFRKENLHMHLFEVAVNDYTIVRARNGEPDAVATTDSYVPGRA